MIMDAFMDDRTFLDVLFEKKGLKKELLLKEWEEFENWWKWQILTYCLVHSMAKLPILGFSFKVKTKKTWKATRIIA